MTDIIRWQRHILWRSIRCRTRDDRGGPIDVLTGDYLAELTMSILYSQNNLVVKTPATSVRFSSKSKTLQGCALKT